MAEPIICPVFATQHETTQLCDVMEPETSPAHQALRSRFGSDSIGSWAEILSEFVGSEIWVWVRVQLLASFLWDPSALHPVGMRPLEARTMRGSVRVERAATASAYSG